MSRFFAPVAILAMISFVAARQPGSNSGHDNRDKDSARGPKGLKVHAELSGDQEVPPNESEAEGRFKIQFDCDFTKARFELEVEANRVLQAHLHCGSAGENGPVVVFLFGMFPGGVDVDGTLSAFTISQANVDAVNADCMNAVGYQIETLEDLANAMAAGDVYANVHTVAFPPGEIRGQLELARRQPRCVEIGNENDNDHGNENENENDNSNDNHDHTP